MLYAPPYVLEVVRWRTYCGCVGQNAMKPAGRPNRFSPGAKFASLGLNHDVAPCIVFAGCGPKRRSATPEARLFDFAARTAVRTGPVNLIIKTKPHGETRHRPVKTIGNPRNSDRDGKRSYVRSRAISLGCAAKHPNDDSTARRHHALESLRRCVEEQDVSDRCTPHAP
jgi:hypothetical protein